MPERIGVRQFLREVFGELRKIAWPTSNSTRRNAVVVLVALVALIALVDVLDLAFGSGTDWLLIR